MHEAGAVVAIGHHAYMIDAIDAIDAMDAAIAHTGATRQKKRPGVR